jgi:hypothetical protein
MRGRKAEAIGRIGARAHGSWVMREPEGVPMRSMRFIPGFELDEILMLTAGVVLIAALVYVI